MIELLLFLNMATCCHSAIKDDDFLQHPLHTMSNYSVVLVCKVGCWRWAGKNHIILFPLAPMQLKCKHYVRIS